MTDAELIRLAATKVIGWHLDAEHRKYWMDGSLAVADASLWNPLTDISDAWMLVEKLRHFRFCLNSCVEDNKEFHWHATLYEL